MSDNDNNNSGNETTPNSSLEGAGASATSCLIQDEMKSCYLDYALSVIIGRALPDVRDGLKPAHRRVLYAMHMQNNYHNRPFMKSARIVGEVIGKYHPHGDGPAYGTMVRLAQDFSMRYTLIEGQGNFGSIDGDNAAAMRYTEVRLEKITEELLADIDKETIDWRPNYDGSLEEPVVLPTRLPNLMINGSTGIAVGMATNIPPHNLREVMDALIALIDNPETKIQDLMKFIPGPDFPTAGTIHGIAGIRSAYLTGRGVIQVRAKTEIIPPDKTFSRERIIISELPYQVIKARLIEKIAYQVNHKEIDGIYDIRDESNRLGIRIVIDIKKGNDANVVLNHLMKQTQLQISFGIILLAIHNNRPKLMNLKELLVSFIDHRREVIVRRTRFDLKKAKERAHILEGLKIAVSNMDAVIALIKQSKNPAEAKEGLITTYALSEIQAQAILEMRLQRLTGLEQEKILKDYNEVMAEIKRLEEILSSEELINKIIRNDFVEIQEKYSDERRTQIIANLEEINVEDLIKKEEVFVTITKNGYIKRMSLDTYRAQKRGGVGVKGAELDDDFYTSILVMNTHADILFFTDKGNVFTIKVYDIPEYSRTVKGKNIVNIIPIVKGEAIKAVIPTPEEKNWEKFGLIIATAKGVVKNSALSDYQKIKSSGIKALKISGEDVVVGVKILNLEKEQDVLMFSSSGKIIRFNATEARQMGRVSQGVRGMSVSGNDRVVGMEVVDAIDDKVELLSVTEKGFGKRTNTSEYRKQLRGGKGILAGRITDKSGDIVSIMQVADHDEIMIITDAGQVIRTRVGEVSLRGRNTGGVILIRVIEGEKVVSMEKIAESAIMTNTELLDDEDKVATIADIDASSIIETGNENEHEIIHNSDDSGEDEN
ncbi:MAG: DNA gyrase subunit A [Oligoflexia bacterium]|nr:DNA gyrase subunit A [Oligoflexia bacterium]MBF0367220.1 DNA gyrase subunit A [Oligoflexia bacterium]